MKHSGKEDHLLKLVIEKLDKAEYANDDLEQCFEIAAHYAKQGHERARKSIYKRYALHIAQDEEWCGESAILALDGFEGLVYILQLKGAKLRKQGGKEEEIEYLLKDFQEEASTYKCERVDDGASKIRCQYQSLFRSIS